MAWCKLANWNSIFVFLSDKRILYSNEVHLHAWIHLSGFLTNLGQDRLQRSEMFSRIFRALQTSRVLHISMNARWHMNQLLNVLIYTVQLKVKVTLYRSTMRSYQATYVDILHKYAYVLLVCAFVIHCPPCALSGIELYKKETVL